MSYAKKLIVEVLSNCTVEEAAKVEQAMRDSFPGGGTLDHLTREEFRSNAVKARAFLNAPIAAVGKAFMLPHNVLENVVRTLLAARKEVGLPCDKDAIKDVIATSRALVQSTLGLNTLMSFSVALEHDILKMYT